MSSAKHKSGKSKGIKAKEKPERCSVATPDESEERYCTRNAAENRKIWSELSKNEMLISLAVQQLPEKSKLSMVKQWNLLDFEEIAKHFIGVSAASCRAQLQYLIKNTVLEKCLHQILEETLQTLPMRKQKKISSFLNFIRQEGENISEDFKKNGGKSWRVCASEIWKNMSKEEKSAYEIGSEVPRRPFILYYADLQKEGCCTYREAKQMWTNLNVEEKCKYIKKSAKLVMPIEKKLMENPKCAKKPSLKELTYYLDFVSLPKKPAKMVQMWWWLKAFGDEDDSTSKLTTAMKGFRLLPKEERLNWTLKHEKAVEKYKTLHKKWKAKQDEVTLFIYRLYKIPASTVLKERKSKAQERKVIAKDPSLANKVSLKSAKKRKKGESDINCKYNVQEMPVQAVVFDGEPALPPQTPFQMYRSELTIKSGAVLSLDQLTEEYELLDTKSKLMLQSKCLVLKKAFIDKLKLYARCLSEHQRKLYLGTKRIFYLRLFGEDIFEEQYPSATYPIYCKPGEKKRFIDNIEKQIDFNVEEEFQNDELTTTTSHMEFAMQPIKEEKPDSDDDYDSEYERTAVSAAPSIRPSIKIKIERTDNDDRSRKRPKLMEEFEQSQGNMDSDGDESDDGDNKEALKKWMQGIIATKNKERYEEEFSDSSE